MAHKKVMISTTEKFERKVSKFIHSQKLKGVKINRSSLDVQAIDEFILKAVQNYEEMEK